MRRYLGALVITVWLVSLASAAPPGPSDSRWWSNAVSGTLYKDGTLTNGPYTVKAVQFPAGVPGIKNLNNEIVPETDVDPMVMLEVYKNGTLIKEIIMNLQSEPYIDPDNEVKISATGFPGKSSQEWVLEYYKPWATISIQRRALPKFDVTVSTVEKTTYISNSDVIITARVTVKNSGDGYAKNVDVKLDTGGLQLRGGDTGQLHQYYYEMESGESQSFDTILIVPNLIDQQSYTLNASAKGLDVKDLEYTSTGSVAVTVSPKQNYFHISKAVRDRIYLQDITIVRITVSNGGMYDIYNIHITDNISNNFELKSNSSLKWDIPLLKPGQEWDAEPYSIKPIEANLNGFTVQAASATFTVNNKPYSASSQATTVVVNGPKLLLNKTVNKPVVNISEDVTVTVSVKNVGNIGTKIEVRDSLPDNVSLVSGVTSLDNYSEPNTPQGFSYIIRMNKEGVIQLPPASANYTGVEYRGTTRSVISSDKPNITVVDPKKITSNLTAASNGSQNPAKTGSSGTTGSPGTTWNPDTGTSSPTNTPDPTPTPITPGFNSALAVIVLIFAAACRRR